MKVGKKRKEALKLFDSTKAYSLKEACEIVKKITTTKFDASVDIDVRLGVDPRQANQMVRGVASLPHGLGNTIRVLVLCTPDNDCRWLDGY
jgi:large subunit ribosomal protein L1